MSYELLFFFILLCKHTIVDWFLQNEWQYKNKGNFKHPGGYFHAFLNVFGSSMSIIIFIFIFNVTLSVSLPVIFLLLFGEFVSHYLMDWTKVNICKKYHWTPTTSEKFWYITGFDQFIHLSYLVFFASIII